MLSYLRTQSPAGEEHRREGSAPSDGVILSLESALAAETTDLTDRYCAICDSLRMPPHSGVLAFIRLRLAELRPRESEGFADRDMYAFCDFLLRELGAAKSVFDHWTRINLERCKIGPGGCRMLARVLRLPGCHVHTVNVSRQAIGAEGAAALVEAIRLNRSISMLDMKLAFVGDCGAAELLELIKDGEGAHNLTEIDLSNNMLTFPTCQQLMIACPKELKLVLKGNRVLDEVLNASSHLVGVILTIIGAIFLGMECADANSDWQLGRNGETYMGVVVDRGPYTVSVVIYLISLLVLYLASTMYHATFAMGDAVTTIFTLLDHSAIYLLIAGTYTPFLCILFPDKSVYSVGLLTFLWGVAFGGIGLAALYSGPFKVGLHIGSYIGMGWACLICMREIVERCQPLPMVLFYLMAGGVLYTAGVPFNVRDKRTCGLPDHTVWHIFVLGGSYCHYVAIYILVQSFPVQDPLLPAAPPPPVVG